MAAALVQPYYLAYGTALTYYGYSERPLHPIWIATTRRKQPLAVGGMTYRFVTLRPAKFFGFSAIDLLDRPVLLAGAGEKGDRRRLRSPGVLRGRAGAGQGPLVRPG